MNTDFQLLEWLPQDVGSTIDNFANFQGSLGRLELYRLRENPFTGIREAHLHSTREVPGLSCMEFCPHSSIGQGNSSSSNDRARDSSAPILAVGTSSGGVSLVDLTSPASGDITVNTQSKYGRRPSTGVAWHPTNPFLAATFDKLRGEHSGIVWDVHAVGRGVSDEDSIVAKFSYDEAASTLAWVNHEGVSPVLAIGTGKGLLKAYDVRTNKPTEVLQVHASSRKIKGLRCAPFHPHLIATFVDSSAEPVKVWDIRKGSTLSSTSSGKPKGEPAFTVLLAKDATGASGTAIGGGGGLTQTPSFSSSATIIDVQWSTHRQNLISAALSQSKDLRFYDIEGSSGNPVFSVPATESADTIRAFAWQRNKGDSGAPPRLLIASSSGILDTMIVESVPLGFSTSNHLAFGAGRLLKTSHIPIEVSDKDLLGDVIGVRDIEMTMRTRASKGYCIDAVKNIQVLNSELSRLHDFAGGLHSKAHTIKQGLCRLWTWVDRVESIISTDVKDLSLHTCGLLAVMQSSIKKEGKSEAVCIDGLRTTQYRSSGREIARRLCGWCGRIARSAGDKFLASSSENGGFLQTSEVWINDEDYLEDLDAFTEECELLDGFERAAAVALLHGNVDKAIQILEKHSFGVEDGAQRYPDPDDHELGYEDMNEISPEYRHLCSLVAMCIAGYSGTHAHLPGEDHGHSHTPTQVHRTGQSSQRRHSVSGGRVDLAAPSVAPINDESGEKPTSAAWISLCGQVIVRIAKATESRPAACYLKMACKFLLCSLRDKYSSERRQEAQEEECPFENGSEGEKYWPILKLKSNNISLEDRAAFACTYLPDEEVIEYLSLVSFVTEVSDIFSMLCSSILHYFDF